MAEVWGRTLIRVWRSIVAAAEERPRGERWAWHEAVVSLSLAQRDLVYAADRTDGRFPGYRTWADLWGWSESQARTLLRDEASWSDPLLAATEAWQTAVPVSRTCRAPVAQDARSSRAVVAHPAQVEPAQSHSESLTLRAPAAHLSRSSRAPSATRARKVEETQTHTLTPTADTDTRAGRAAIDVGQVEVTEQSGQTLHRKRTATTDAQVQAIWDHYRTRCPERRSDTPPAYLAKPLASAAKQHQLADLHTLIDWLADAGGRTAYLRDGGYAWGETPWRASKLGQYLDLARDWHSRGRIDAPPPQRQPADPWGEQLRAARQRADAQVIDLPYMHHQPAPAQPRAALALAAPQPTTTTTELADHDDIPF